MQIDKVFAARLNNIPPACSTDHTGALVSPLGPVSLLGWAMVDVESLRKTLIYGGIDDQPVFEAYPVLVLLTVNPAQVILSLDLPEVDGPIELGRVLTTEPYWRTSLWRRVVSNLHVKYREYPARNISEAKSWVDLVAWAEDWCARMEQENRR